ncbi:hypothetical protein ACIQ4I_13515 [Rummeliibacillus sp. NPDC094406]|uniref:hypothetical protein n=1 Tax=Rummeliibacillus sp. NPDC094406 TaxID=3364511 RepID=UPI00382CC9E6
MNFLSKKFLGNSIIVWIIISLLYPIGLYYIIMKHNAQGFYFLLLGTGLSFLFENVIFKKKEKEKNK